MPDGKGKSDMRVSRRIVATLLSACTVVAVTAAPVQAKSPGSGPASTGAAPTTTTPPSVRPRIVGGFQAPPGAWPSQVGLLHSNEANNFQAQFCGGTVLNPSWILTAAHCADEFTAGQVDVLTNTQSLVSGGVRHRAAELRISPHWNPSTDNGDFALVRIGDPTTAPAQALAGQGATVAPGTFATVTGWGNLVSGGNDYPAELQQATVSVVSNATCRNDGYGSQITAEMICAGVYPYQTTDTCDGDSGGPLLVDRGNRWVQIGITSWGYGCADGAPGVYARVAAESNWISAQIRFGPHPDATSFVLASWRDLYGGTPSNLDRFYSVAAQNSTSPAAWLSQRIQGSRYQNLTGGVTRLYEAFFLRDPDIGGMNFWWGKANGGWSLGSIAQYFSHSPEFLGRYGSLSNAAYVDLLYHNVLGRAPDPTGRAYWLDQLDRGARNRGQVMIGFSESREYVQRSKARVDVVINYFGLVRRMPEASALSFWMTRSNASLVSALFDSVEYHRRF